MARRKKFTPLEDVLDLLAMLPWWICVVLAAVSYFLLHRLAAPIQASDIQGQGGVMEPWCKRPLSMAWQTPVSTSCHCFAWQQQPSQPGGVNSAKPWFRT